MKRIFTLLTFLLVIGQANAQIVINEVDYDQPSVDSAEYIEIYNNGSSTVDLSLYQVILYNGSTSPTGNVPYDTIALSGNLSAGDFYVIGTNLVPNVDLIVPMGASGFLQNGAGAGQTGSPDAIAIQQIQSATMVDVLSYEGDCPSPWVEGTGLSSADSDTLTSDSIAHRHLSIGRFPDGDDSNNNSVDFQRMCGTPGTANVSSATSCTVGLLEAKKDITFRAWPNPTKGVINVDLTSANLKNVTVVLSDILGKELRRTELGNFSSVYQMDLSEYHYGFYFVKVISDKGEAAQRIILTK